MTKFSIFDFSIDFPNFFKLSPKNALFTTQYKPLTTLDKCTNIQFLISSFQDKLIDLNSVYLKLQIQLVKADGSVYDKDTKNVEIQAFIVNNMMHSIFKSCKIELNNQVVSDIQFYNYKSYLEDLPDLHEFDWLPFGYRMPVLWLA